VDKHRELYDDPKFEMYSDKEQCKAMLKAYAFAFAVVCGIIMPWAVGSFILIKWIVF
jgi:hypothetical protein